MNVKCQKLTEVELCIVYTVISSICFIASGWYQKMYQNGSVYNAWNNINALDR